MYVTCPTCSQKSPKVYELAWVCLNPACSSFWVDTESRCFLPYNLTYDPKFLRLSQPYLLPLNLRDIRPTPPEIAGRSIGTTYAFTRGLHCRHCGRLSCRYVVRIHVRPWRARLMLVLVKVQMGTLAVPALSCEVLALVQGSTCLINDIAESRVTYKNTHS